MISPAQQRLLDGDRESFSTAATAISHLYTSSRRAYANGIQHACDNIDKFVQQQQRLGSTADGTVPVMPLLSLVQLLRDLSGRELAVTSSSGGGQHTPDGGLDTTPNPRKSTRSSSPTNMSLKRCKLTDDDDDDELDDQW
eukprot:PhM_4_TR16039/c0_g1_i1/m.103332